MCKHEMLPQGQDGGCVNKRSMCKHEPWHPCDSLLTTCLHIGYGRRRDTYSWLKDCSFWWFWNFREAADYMSWRILWTQQKPRHVCGGVTSSRFLLNARKVKCSKMNYAARSVFISLQPKISEAHVRIAFHDGWIKVREEFYWIINGTCTTLALGPRSYS